MIRNAPGNSVPWKQSTAMTRNVLPARRHGRKKPPVNPANMTVKITIMKPPTLKTIRETLNCKTRKHGDVVITQGNYRLLIFTSSFWQRNRRVLSIRLFPERDKPATLQEGADTARRLSKLWGYVIKWEFRQMLFETEPSGKSFRCPFRSGYLNRKLP